MTKRNYSLIIAGVGGQGNMLAARIVAEAALEDGHMVIVAETYGGAMRGGPVFSLVRFGEGVESTVLLEDSLDVLVGLDPIEAIRQGLHYISPDGEVIVNTAPVMPADVNLGLAQYPGTRKIVESLRLLCRKVTAFDGIAAAKEAGSARSLNMVMTGALAESELLPFSSEKFEQAVLKRVPRGTEEMNLKAFRAGRLAYGKLGSLPDRT